MPTAGKRAARELLALAGTALFIICVIIGMVYAVRGANLSQENTEILRSRQAYMDRTEAALRDIRSQHNEMMRRMERMERRH